jgi:hypothetical protein
MNSSFIEAWFAKEYRKYEIRSQRKGLFQKFRQIVGPYEITQENNLEYFSDDGQLKILYWEDQTKFKGERLTFNESEQAYTYEHWYMTKPQPKEGITDRFEVRESSKCSELVEEGEITIDYKNYMQITKWKIEYSKSDVCRTDPLHEISYKGQRPSAKGLVIFDEHLTSTLAGVKISCTYNRGTVEIKVEEYKTNSSTTKKIRKTGCDLEKTTEIIIEGGRESQQIQRIRRGEKWLKFSEKNENYWYEESQTDLGHKNIGKIVLKENKNGFQASWILTDNYVLGKIIAERDGSKVEKHWRLNSLGVSTMLEFEKNNLIWGIIKEDDQSSTSTINWTDTKPSHYDLVKKKLSMRGTVILDPKHMLKLERETIISDIREEAKFLYESQKTLSIYEFRDYESQVPNPFAPPIISTEALLIAFKHSAYSLINSNANRISNLLSQQSVSDFSSLFSTVPNPSSLPSLCKSTERISNLLAALQQYSIKT